MTQILPLQRFRSLLHNCGCVTINLRGVEAVPEVHIDFKLELYDPRITSVVLRLEEAGWNNQGGGAPFRLHEKQIRTMY